MTIRQRLRRLRSGAAREASASQGAPAARAASNVGDEEATSRAIHALVRQVAELRGLLHQQASFTMEALQRAGWQSDEEASQQAALQRALRAMRGGGDVVVGPWTGEVGFELLYWIPF